MAVPPLGGLLPHHVGWGRRPPLQMPVQGRHVLLQVLDVARVPGALLEHVHRAQVQHFGRQKECLRHQRDATSLSRSHRINRCKQTSFTALGH